MTAPFPQPHGPMPGILYLRQGFQYRFWLHDDVALLRDEGTGRVEVTSADGEVAHCIAALSDFEHPPWIRVAPGVLIHPAHAHQQDGVLVLPGGWRIPHGGRVPPRFPPSDAEPVIPGTQIRRSDVVGLRTHQRRVWWITDQGEIPTDCTPHEAARLHGDIIRVGWSYVNRRRIRAMFVETAVTWIVLDNGQQLQASCMSVVQHIRRSLGLPALQSEEPPMTAYHRSLFLMELRDYPFDLFEAPAEFLQSLCHGVAERLVAHVLWQTFRWRSEGRTLTWGRRHRGYWYRPLLPILTRAGFRRPPTLEAPLGPARQYDDTALYLLFQRVCSRMIDEHRLFTYSALGFEDHRPDLREVGTIHPDVVILCEKVALTSTVRRLAARFGVSFQVYHGQPKLLDTEYLVKALQPHVHGKLHVVTLVDYDYSGHIIAEAFVKQLALHGLETRSLEHLVTPGRFTEAEVHLYSYPIKATRQQATKLRRWVKDSGGIHGKPRGMHSDHLQPFDRVERAFMDLTGLKAVPQA